MSAENLFKAKTESVYDLFSQPAGVHYYIPAYQRPFKWERKNIQRLMEDCSFGMKNLLKDHEGYSFVGTIITIQDTRHETIHPMVLGDLPAQIRLVIDGQQRMTCLSMILLHLHNRLRLAFQDDAESIRNDAPEVADWIKQRVNKLLTAASSTLIAENSSFGETSSWYPKIIRAYLDTWIRLPQEENYHSPIAKAVSEYQKMGGFDYLKPPKAYVPKVLVSDAGNYFRNGFINIKSMVDELMTSGLGPDSILIPTYGELLGAQPYQEFFQTNQLEIDELFPNRDSDNAASDIIRLSALTAYFLSRVAITSVNVSKDEYAFAVFDSLNTTGVPLTPYETLRPIVMKAVGLSSYENSPEKKILDEVDLIIGDISQEKNIKTSEVVAIDFALAEFGDKISKRSDEQRSMYKLSFRHVEADTNDRQDYLRQLRDIAELRRKVFDNWRKPLISSGIITELSGEAVLALSFLAKLPHTIVIPLLSRFVTPVKQSKLNTDERKFAVAELDSAIKAVCAFSCLYRSTRRDTDGIDEIYRQIMRGNELMRDNINFSSPVSLGAFQRSALNILSQKRDLEPPSASRLREELWSRLSFSKPHKGIANKNQYVKLARDLDVYEINKDLARFLLLIAQHNSAESASDEGLLVSATPGLNECLNLMSWVSDETNSVEHIAPQNPSIGGWSLDVYASETTKHSLGNLTLCPSGANSALSNRPWSEKVRMFQALSSSTTEEAEAAIVGIYIEANARKKFVDSIRYVPYLKAIGMKSSDWDLAFIEKRSECLYGRVWDVLKPWLD